MKQQSLEEKVLVLVDFSLGLWLRFIIRFKIRLSLVEKSILGRYLARGSKRRQVARNGRPLGGWSGRED